MTNEQIVFINEITTFVKKYAPLYGINENCVVAIVSQACIESNFNKSKLSSKYHNYFGMKCGSSWKGKSVNMSTCEEYTAGVLTSIKDNFRVYDSMDAGVKGYFDFISMKRYSNLKTATSPRQYLEFIKADGYATSSKYVSTVMTIVNQIQALNTSIDIEAIAKEVIAGKWGNGATRRTNLTNAGYNYKEVQNKVNELLRR